jgi:arabinosaccharide transport system substrate-binding protein
MALTFRRRDVLRATALLLASSATEFLLAACGGTGGGAARTGPGNAAGPVTLEEWNFSSTRVAWQQEALKLYHQKVNPDLNINWVTFPYGEMHEKLLMTSIAGTGGPDIADVEISAFSRFLKEKNPGFVPLNSRLNKVGALNNLYQPSATDPWTWNNQILGLGNELNVTLWTYNWQLLQQYKINLPITTWEQFAEEGKALYSRSKGKTVLMDFNDLGWGYWWMMALEGGGGFFNAQAKPILDDDANVRTLQYQQDAVYKDKWSIPSPAGNAYNAALQDKSIASILGASWEFAGFTQQALPNTKGWWTVQLMPRWSTGGTGAATYGGTGVAAMAVGKSPQVAADYVVWEHTTPEAVLFDYKIRQTWPTLKTAWSAPELTAPIPFFNNQQVGKVIEQAAPMIPKWYNSPFWAEVTDASVRLGITPAMHNQMPAQAALQSAEQNSLYLIQVESAQQA